MIGAAVVTQIAATPAHKRPPYNVNWYLHPQRLVDVGGRRLNILCTGKGSPTVILEAGLVADSAAWRLVQPAISRKTRVCSYDRAGLGFSDFAGAPRDAAAIVRDLHALLRRVGIAPPYVLVGWSSGGLYTRLYQYRFPEEVAGLVEVDPDSEFETLADDSKIVTTVMKKPPQWFDQQVRDWYKQYDTCAVDVSREACAFFPGLTAYNRHLRAAGCPAISPAACAVAEVQGQHLNRGSLWRDEELELEAGDKSAAEVRAAEHPYGNLPLIVLTDSENEDIDNGGPVSVAAQQAEWVAKDKAEERLAGLSTVGAHFVIENSPHAIQLYHPAVVISAVDEVVEQARYKRSRP
ncbi:MAG TPA: alpha/beta hydrolase [Candidatus Baltobacteraceae bacterium]